MISHFVLTGEVLPLHAGECDDVCVTHRALQTISGAVGQDATIDVADCGAAYRFMMALLAVTPGKWLLTGTPRLLQRPVEGLCQALTAIGASLAREEKGWRIVGQTLSAQTIVLDARQSSQYASALLLIAPKLGLKRLELTPDDVPSKPYIQLTRLCMSDPVDIPGLPQPQGPLGHIGDWSAALFWYAQALLSPAKIFELRNLSLSSAQGDAIVAEWFRMLGVRSAETEQGVSIVADHPIVGGSFRFDVADHPDVVPVMAALACLLPADFTFVHTRNLDHKESQRAVELERQLAPFATIERTDDQLRVVGKARAEWPKPPYEFNTCRDHRLAMAFLLFGEDARLDDMTCLRKSYPQLPDILQSVM